MTVFVDSNILIDIFTADATWGDRSASALRRTRAFGPIINAIVYGEVAIGFETPADLDTNLRDLGLTMAPIPREAAFRAGQAFARSRRGSERRGILPDFMIGAHAQVLGATLLTRNARDFRRAFPDLTISEP